MSCLDEAGAPWNSPSVQRQAAIILDSFARFLNRELIQRAGHPAEDSRRLFEAPFVVVSHDTQSDPSLNYANAAALELWECSLDTLMGLPSRQTAEPQHRDERARMLARTTSDGFIDDYEGIRISTRGQRFLIRKAIVWNLVDSDGNHAGQAATFDQWEFLDAGQASLIQS